MKHFFLTITVITLTSFCVIAQIEVPQHIAQKLQNDKSFKSYAFNMTQYLDSLLKTTSDTTAIKAINKKYKYLARQLYYLEGHQDENGNIVNASLKNFEAVEDLRSEHSADAITSVNGAWTRIGPDLVITTFGTKGIGRVDRIAFHPTLENTMYAGTPCGGIFKTTNGGSLWSNLNNYIPSLGISGIVVSHANPSVLYALSGDGDSNLGIYGFVEGMDYIRPSIGVLKSSDDGNSWQRTNLNIPGFYVGYKLVQSPTDANILIAATSKGLYRTDNGGSSWNMVSADSSRYYDVEWKPGSSAQLYAVTATKFFMSVSSGQTWADLTHRITEDISNCGRLALAVTPANSSYVYLLAGSPSSGSYNNLRTFRSINSAGTFFLRSDQSYSGGNVRYMLNVGASPLNANHIVIGNLKCHYSEDGGTTFVRHTQSDDDNLNSYVHADVHELAFNPINGKLFIGSDGGVFMTDDHGLNHINRLTGLTATQFYHMDVNDANADHMIGGAQDNGIMYKDDNTSFFTNYRSGDGFDISYPHGYGTGVVATINTNTYFFYEDFPSDAYVISQANNVWYKPVAYSYFDSSKFIGSVSQIIKWVVVNPTVTPAVYSGKGNWALITSPSNNNRLYAAGGGDWNHAGLNNQKDLMRSDDKAVTWTSLRNMQGFPDTVGKITAIAVHPDNSNSVYFTLGGYQSHRKVYFSSTTGNSWVNISGGLPNVPVNAIAVHPNGDVYIGNDIGVFLSKATSGNWVPFFNGLPKIPVTELKIVGNTLYASTFGRGMWKTDLAGACPSSIFLSAAQSGRVFYEAGTITATAVLIDGAGTEIYAKAETEATLLPGFRANAGSGEQFRSWIANCGTGGVPLMRANLQFRNALGLKIDNEELSFNLPFGALVSFYSADDTFTPVNKIGPSYRLQEGPQKIKLRASSEYEKILVVADGTIVGTLKKSGNQFIKTEN